MGLYSFYERRIFPHVLDRAMRRMGDLRDETLALAEGDVLEVGFGTGLNLRHYPPAVKRLSTVDPMTALPEKVAERVARAPFPVERHALAADGGLPFDDARFDTVTVTWTLCTIPDVAAALRDMRRVLRPGGHLLFIEHGRSDVASVARWQDRLNPIQNVVGCGCNLNRRIDALVSDAGFAIERLDRFVADGAPAIFATMYRGVATRG
ncbi:MAG: class I SAM-dependent methyltransferase [Myxococcota bacterium]|nr:class I SAM-dependent methyltransferase [Myxococcales bacterium]